MYYEHGALSFNFDIVVRVLCELVCMFEACHYYKSIFFCQCRESETLPISLYAQITKDFDVAFSWRFVAGAISRHVIASRLRLGFVQLRALRQLCCVLQMPK